MKVFTRCFADAICVSLILLLAGCASNQPLNTPSGKPEVTIHGATRQDIRDTIVDQMTKDGWQVRRVKDNVVVVGRPTSNVDTILSYASPSNTVPEKQMTFTLNDRSHDNIQVICTGTIVTNAGSGFENVADIDSGSFNKDAQAILDKIQIEMRGMPHSVEQDK